MRKPSTAGAQRRRSREARKPRGAEAHGRASPRAQEPEAQEPEAQEPEAQQPRAFAFAGASCAVRLLRSESLRRWAIAPLGYCAVGSLRR